MMSMQAESEEIHKNLRKSVQLFSYWVRNIETYLKKSHELFKCKKEIDDIRQLIDERSANLEQEPRVGTGVGSPERLPTLIRKFNNELTLPVAIKNVFEILQDEKENESTDLCLEDFDNVPEQTIIELFDRIKPQTVIIESETENNARADETRVREGTIKKNIIDLISAIKSYQLAIKSDEDLKDELELKEKKEKEIEKVMRRIEELNFRNQAKSKKADSTNFVAAEMGFLVEVLDEGNEERRTKYYHYPVTFSNKNTFSIYDLQNEEFNYFLFKKGKICHNNYIVDDVIIKPAVTGEGRSEADPSNDNHSESVLFFLCQQRSFHEKMISELIKDLKKEDLKLSKLERLIFEIHSSRDICVQCFQKAEYLMNWKEENGTLEENNQENHFLLYFKNVFTKKLEKEEVLDQNSKIKLKVEIRFSYDKPYDKASKKPHHRFHRIPSNDVNSENSQFSITLDSGRTLSNYSVITSGGVAKSHNNYCYAYNKAVDPARIYAKDKIKNAWREQWLN